MRHSIIALICFLALSGPAIGQAEQLNFSGRQAIIIDQPGVGVQLKGFSFKNDYVRSSFRLVTGLGWQNVSSKPVVAFEVVILRYDPFNRPIPGGGRWLVTGKNSGDWAPLMPGESSTDGLTGFDDEPVLTSIVYVRAVRYSDGSVWFANIPGIEKSIRARLPVLSQLGDISPSLDKKKKE